MQQNIPDSSLRITRIAGESWKILLGPSVGFGPQDGYYLGLGGTIGAITPSCFYFAFDFKYFFGNTINYKSTNWDPVNHYYYSYYHQYIYTAISVGGEFGYSGNVAKAFHIRPYVRPAYFNRSESYWGSSENTFAFTPGVSFDILPNQHFMISIDNSYNLAIGNNSSGLSAYCIFLKFCYIFF